MKHEQASRIAAQLIVDLSTYCEHIKVGGSIRRKKPDVKDIELICIPKFGDVPTGQMSLEGDPMTSHDNLLFDHIATNRDEYDIIKMGEKYAQIQLDEEHASIKVDVFTATFRTWGYILMIRTGPAEFSKWVVTELKKEGFVPEGGEVLHHETPCTIPSEDDLFFLLGSEYIEPEDRRAP